MDLGAAGLFVFFFFAAGLFVDVFGFLLAFALPFGLGDGDRRGFLAGDSLETLVSGVTGTAPLTRRPRLAGVAETVVGGELLSSSAVTVAIHWRR